MSNLIMQFDLTVRNSKYRELLNILERELSREIPYGCQERKVLQSLDDMNVFNFKLLWHDHTSMNTYLNSHDFKVLNGGLTTLCDKLEFEVFESHRIKMSV